MRFIFIALLLFIHTAHAKDEQPPIRFGLTAVVLTENLRLLDQWRAYLETKIGRKVEFVQRKSYREVMDLLDSGGVEFAWICGFPYVQKREPESLQLLTIPVYRGEPLYHSYIIVHHDSIYKHFSDLKGKTFAFSDPDSNSGFLYPLALLTEEHKKPETFFRLSFFTFNHAETIQAVSEGVADGGAVDSYIWEHLAIIRPDITKKTRIIKKSPKFGFPPIVSRLGVGTKTIKMMKEALEDMDKDKAGKELLNRLRLDDFAEFPDSLFNEIRSMAGNVQRENPSRVLSEK